MPAVRMISVWAIASVPTTATCCVMSERFAGRRKRSLSRPKTITASTSTMAGLMAGYRCRTLRMRLSGVVRSRNSSARSSAAVGGSVVC
jgi:hypothetical protein